MAKVIAIHQPTAILDLLNEAEEHREAARHYHRQALSMNDVWHGQEMPAAARRAQEEARYLALSSQNAAALAEQRAMYLQFSVQLAGLREALEEVKSKGVVQ